MTPLSNNTPPKYCECGCGSEITSRYRVSDIRTGQCAGELVRFLPGHQFKKTLSPRWAKYKENKIKELKGKKICSWCNTLKEITEFYPSKNGLYHVGSRCKECSDQTSIQWAREHPKWAYQKRQNGYQRVKCEVFLHYGNTCKCCGENEPMFLTIDHINNDGGGRDRKERGYAMYQKIIERGFPDTYQVLCWNCNVGKQRNGGKECPHKSLAKKLVTGIW